jgi:hypothetical protein
MNDNGAYNPFFKFFIIDGNINYNRIQISKMPPSYFYNKLNIQ